MEKGRHYTVSKRNRQDIICERAKTGQVETKKCHKYYRQPAISIDMEKYGIENAAGKYFLSR